MADEDKDQSPQPETKAVVGKTRIKTGSRPPPGDQGGDEDAAKSGTPTCTATRD